MSDRSHPRILQTPTGMSLHIWMLVPLSMILFFPFIRYVFNSPVFPKWMVSSLSNGRDFGSYHYGLSAKDFWFAFQNSLLTIGSIFILTVVLGLGISVLINMILDPVLGLNGLAIGGLSEMVDGLRDFPVFGSFFSMWPE